MEGTALRAIESDALIESSFRRLLSSIESERERIRGTWQQVEQERDATTLELQRIRFETQDWCYAENQKIEAEWKRLDTLSERMSSIWPDQTELLEINCSGDLYTIPRSTLCSLEGSYLAHMFSDAFIDSINKDSQGRYYLDFNPHCFRLIINYLQNRRLRVDVPIPIVPADQQKSMDRLAEALKLRPFLHENKVSAVHGTSLHVAGNVIEASHPGWQVISASYPLPMAGASYFEVKVLGNPDARGGLAFGVCGHIPQGTEVHSIRLPDCVLYNSNNGLIGDAFGDHNVAPGVQFVEGSILGVKHEVDSHTLWFYHNFTNIGVVQLKEESIAKLTTMYPVFALYVPGQRILVDFDAKPPEMEGPPAIHDG